MCLVLYSFFFLFFFPECRALSPQVSSQRLMKSQLTAALRPFPVWPRRRRLRQPSVNPSRVKNNRSRCTGNTANPTSAAPRRYKRFSHTVFSAHSPDALLSFTLLRLRVGVSTNVVSGFWLSTARPAGSLSKGKQSIAVSP